MFRAAEGAFTVELFNQNETTKDEEKNAAEGMGRMNEPVLETDEIRTAVYQRAKEQGRVTRKELEEEFDFGSTKAFKVLKKLCDLGLLSQQKNGNRTVYLPVK